MPRERHCLRTETVDATRTGLRLFGCEPQRLFQVKREILVGRLWRKRIPKELGSGLRVLRASVQLKLCLHQIQRAVSGSVGEFQEGPLTKSP